MTIIDSELKLYKSSIINDTGTNGGRLSSTEAVSAVSNNVFPNVYTADRVAGLTTHRKTFFKVGNDDDETLYYPQIWMDIVTTADDWCSFFVGTQRDVESGIAGTEHKYGCSTLNANVSAGAATLDVDVENVALATGNDKIFTVGDKFRITDKATIDGAGNEETHTLTSVSNVDTVVSLGFSATTLANSYTTASNTRVMTVYEPSDITCSVDNWAETCAGDGTYDETTYPVVTDNIGTVEETWTLTFTSATAFGVVGDTIGSVGTGTTAGDFAPSNADFSKPYFTLDKDGWAGTWASGDTVVFQTHPAAVPLWQVRTVPAACGSLNGNKTTLVLGGES